MLHDIALYKFNIHIHIHIQRQIKLFLLIRRQMTRSDFLKDQQIGVDDFAVRLTLDAAVAVCNYRHLRQTHKQTCQSMHWRGMASTVTHTWAWRAIQQQTKKLSEGARCHSQPHLRTSLQLQQLSSGINRASLRIGTSAIHMPGSIEYSQAASTVTSVGHGIGPGTSA